MLVSVRWRSFLGCCPGSVKNLPSAGQNLGGIVVGILHRHFEWVVLEGPFSSNKLLSYLFTYRHYA